MLSFLTGSEARADADIVASDTNVTFSSIFGISDRGRPTERNVRRSLRGTFAACVRERAKLTARSAVPDLMSEGFRVERRTPDGWERVEENHPWMQLIQAPNRYRSAYEVWYWVSMAADLYGTASLIVGDDPRGVPEQLLEVYSVFGQIRAKGNRQGGIDGYVYQRNGTPIRDLEHRDVMQVRRTDPTSPFESTSLLEELMHEVNADRYAATFRESTFKDGRPPLIQLTTDQEVSQKRAKEIGTRWKNEYMQEGGDVKGVPVGTHGLKAESISISPDEFQMLESQGLDHDVIFRVTGINSAWLDQGSNRAEAEQAEKRILKGTIQPRLNRIAGQLTTDFRTAFDPDIPLRVRAPDVRPKDPEQQEAVNAQRIKRGVPRAQIMRENGEDVPDEYEDELETPLRPSTLSPESQGDGESSREPPDFL